MSKTHKITQLKKRIAKLEKRLEKFNTLDTRIKFERHEIVELQNVTQIDLGRMRYTPSEADFLQKAIYEMFDIHEHPEIVQLFTCTEYVSRLYPGISDEEIHTYETKCKIVKPEITYGKIM